MLVGIVFSIPLLVFTVYTVLTVYVDENGLTNPSSVFIKVDNNEDPNHSLSDEDLVKEAEVVTKEKPDMILKAPGYFRKPNFTHNRTLRRKREVIIGIPLAKENKDENGTTFPFDITCLLPNISSSDTDANPETQTTDSQINSTLRNGGESTDSETETTDSLVTSTFSGIGSTMNGTEAIDLSTLEESTQTVDNSTTSESNLPDIDEPKATSFEAIFVKKNPDVKFKTSDKYFTKLSLGRLEHNILKLIKDMTVREKIVSKNLLTNVQGEDKTNAIALSFGDNSSTPDLASTVTPLTDNMSSTTQKISSTNTETTKSTNFEQKSTGPKTNSIEKDSTNAPQSTTSKTPIKDDKQNTGIMGKLSRYVVYLREFSVRQAKAIFTFFESIWTKLTGTQGENFGDGLDEFARFQQFIRVNAREDDIDSGKYEKNPVTQEKGFIFEEIETNSPQKTDDESHLRDKVILFELIERLNASRLIPNKTKENLSQNDNKTLAIARDNESSMFSILWPGNYYTTMLGYFYSCPLPENVTNTFYSIKDCPTCSKGFQDAHLYISCSDLFVPPEPQKIVCSLGEWLTAVNQKPITKFPRCKKTRSYKKCPQLSIHTPDRGVSVECAQNGYPVDCESYNITWYSGTELKIVCPPNYRANFNTKLSTERRSVPRDSTLCDENGHWIKNNVSCQPECGVLGKDSAVTTLVMNGHKAPAGYFPWVVALFLRDGGGMEYICTGSIITDRSIVTAGHCVYTREPSEILILPGTTKLNKNESLLYKVSEIKIPYSYSDKQGNYGSDIAVLVMETSFKFNDLVRPVCVDWDNKYTVRNQKAIGKVAGWGLDENFKEVSELKFADLPLVSMVECSRFTPIGFKKFLGFTTFCAGYKNGTGVCNGDSGSGFMLEHEGLWYIAGTVSISPRQLDSIYCESKSYSIYTKVELFIPWIKAIVTNSTTF